MPKMISASAGILLAVFTLVPDAAHGQARQGVWVGAGAGYGSADASCDECHNDAREAVRSAYVTAGWTVTPRFLLGAEFNAWSDDDMNPAPSVDMSVKVYGASATVTFYPRASADFFVRGGVGASFVDTDFNVGGSAISADLGKGVGLVAGAGYDVRLGPRVSLTPAVNVRVGYIGDLGVDGETFVSGWKQNVVDVTIGLTFH
jgi:hypothetical protein